MCSVVGVYNNKNAARKCFYSLFSMQHRGQEAAGISSNKNGKIHTIKDRGLVTEIFKEEHFSNVLNGDMAIGHTRYSTAGDDSILDAQPVYAKYGLGEISIVHNGNLTNKEQVREDLINKGAIFQTNMDTENLIHLIAKNQKTTLQERIVDAVNKIEGAFSLIVLSRTKMFAIRDRFGFRPLSIGKIKSGGYIVASETCAFELVGAEYVRDVEAGEMVIFENNNMKSIKLFDATPKKCIFEYIYFARPDSDVFGKNVYERE